MKLRIISVLLLLSLSACGAASSVTVPTKSITYELCVGGVRQYTVDALKAGDEIFNEPLGIRLGTIQAIRTEPSEGIYSYPDGTARYSDIDGRWDVFLTVTADLEEDPSGGYRAGSYHFDLNQKNTFWTKYCKFDGIITQIGP